MHDRSNMIRPFLETLYWEKLCASDHPLVGKQPTCWTWKFMSIVDCKIASCKILYKYFAKRKHFLRKVADFIMYWWFIKMNKIAFWWLLIWSLQIWSSISIITNLWPWPRTSGLNLRWSHFIFNVIHFIF